MAMQYCMAINIYEFTRHSIYIKIINDTGTRYIERMRKALTMKFSSKEIESSFKP